MIDLASLMLAFTAGVFTVFSPCSFPLLPGYFSYRLSVSSSRGKTVAAGLICALGLVSVFCVIAVLLSLAGAVLSTYVSSLPLVAGIVIVVFGVVMLTGAQFSHSPFVSGIGKGHDILGTFSYGVVYGFASTACSAPIFYSIVLYSLTSKGVVEGAVTFGIYSLGIGVPLVLISVLVGFGRSALVQRFSALTPILNRISGALLIGFGLYQIYRYLRAY